MEKPSKETHTLEHAELSSRVKRWRIEKGLSQAELAEKSGFARSTLSKIENGQLSPTFEVLLKLSHGFSVDITNLLGPENKQALVGRLSVDRNLPSEIIEYTNNRLYPLAAQFKDKLFQSFIVEFTSSTLETFGSWNQHDTEDMLYVLSGLLEFHSDGYEAITLKTGQSIYFDGRMSHACISAGEDLCRCLYVFVPRTPAR